MTVLDLELFIVEEYKNNGPTLGSVILGESKK